MAIFLPWRMLPAQAAVGNMAAHVKDEGGANVDEMLIEC
jgi:hypothetical protein